MHQKLKGWENKKEEKKKMLVLLSQSPVRKSVRVMFDQESLFCIVCFLFDALEVLMSFLRFHFFSLFVLKRSSLRMIVF